MNFENYHYRIPGTRIKKVIIDTDAKNEADDQFAITHALLSPSFDIRGVIATHFGHARIEDSMEASWEELNRILGYMGLQGKVRAVKGCRTNIKMSAEPSFFKWYKPEESDGVELIIEEADRCLNEKLWIGVLGPMTNVASALLKRPDIGKKLVVVWNGGATYPAGGREFNLVNDIAAANVVLQSDAEVWQIPTKVYDMPRVSLAELQVKLEPCGEIGHYLFRQLIEFLTMADANGWPMSEVFSICDETVIGALLDEQPFNVKWTPAPAISEEMFYFPRENAKMIKVYQEMDLRVVLEDLFCKLAICYPPKK
ncbi:MAG TPA: nucleoside hydrolase [Oscillospiraceae bacterium]|nr:nucleoside hydrolase [Oscillospiraceae bacterium]HNW04041.1 nucleoside hydrolase [Oscillospiraceae bacterium]